jgi:acid stress-induced BolA-like protein IbaG/YrbA
MHPDEVKRLIEDGLPGARVDVTGDGSHFDAVIVSEDFSGKRPLERQRMVFATLGERISNGTLHALSMKTYTPAEWDAAQRS